MASQLVKLEAEVAGLQREIERAEKGNADLARVLGRIELTDAK